MNGTAPGPAPSTSLAKVDASNQLEDGSASPTNASVISAKLRSRMAMFEEAQAARSGTGITQAKRDSLRKSTMPTWQAGRPGSVDLSSSSPKQSTGVVASSHLSSAPGLQPAADILSTNQSPRKATSSPSLTNSGPSSPTQSPSRSPASLRKSRPFLDVESAQKDASIPAPSPTSVKSIVSDTSNIAATVIFGIVLVDFDHALGPKVEFSHPAYLQHDFDLNSNLPFLALPDGAHARDEDYSYFHLLCPSISQTTIFGISCNRQIASSQLLNRTATVTRSTVQKAIVVLASKPVFGPIRDKLGVITRAYFAQKDFREKDILVDFNTSLQDSLSGSLMTKESEAEDGALYMGTSIRELINKFRFKTLMLLKLLLLQRKIMFYGSQVERLCTFQYSLVSLIPNLLLHLEDSASPLLDSLAGRQSKPTELRTSDRRSLLRFLGLPLNIFGQNAFFQPYLPLQQIDLVESEDVSYLVGTTNSIFQQQKDCKIDVIVNIDTATIDFHDQTLASICTLTAADRKWMDEIVSTVQDTWNAADPARPIGMKFVGSDDYLRAKFEEYICSTLAAIKFVDFLAKGKNNTVLISHSDISAGLSSYNEAWVAAFRRTRAFTLWNENTDPVIFDLIEPRHPCEGMTNVVSDVGIRLVQGMHDLHLDENLAPAREAIGKGIQTGTQSVWALYSSVRNDLSKRQSEFMEKRARDQAEQHNKTPKSQITDTKSEDNTPTSSQLKNDGTIRPSSLATSVGSFFAAKRNQLFSSPVNIAETSHPDGLPNSRRTTTLDALLSTEDKHLSSGGDTFPPSVPVQTPVIANTAAAIGSFFRSPSASLQNSAINNGTSQTPAASSTLSPSTPSFFRRVSSVLTSAGPVPVTAQEIAAKPAPLKELSLSSSPNQSTLRSPRSSPSISPRTGQPSRPSSVASSSSNRSGLGSRRSSFQVIEEEDTAR